MPEKIQLQSHIPEVDTTKRLDVVLAELFPEYSRSRMQQWIKQGKVTLAGAVCTKPRASYQIGDEVVVNAEIEAAGDWQPQDLDIKIVFEDDHLIVVNKQAGLVVHPGVGNKDKTLVNGLLHLYPELEALPRAGIVHRLDKDTTGLLVVARNLISHNHLVSQLQQRAFSRQYLALTEGKMIVGGTVDKPIGRHPTQRTRMAVVASGKEAITHYRVEKTFRGHSFLSVKLETGRTHQIRVHMSYLGYPLTGDQLYRGRLKMPAGASEEMLEALRHFKRQALHAQKLGLTHPSSGEWIEWEAQLPDDFQTLLTIMENDARQ
jgi:23S rRNA pseudouridine1911/1915/1917 synthase